MRAEDEISGLLREVCRICQSIGLYAHAAQLSLHDPDPMLARDLHKVDPERTIGIAMWSGQAELLASALTQRGDIRAIPVWRDVSTRSASGCGQAVVGLLRLGAAPAAEEVLRSGLARFGAPLSLQIWRGWLCLWRGDPAAALRAIPHNAREARCLIGACYCAQGRLAEADEMLKAAVADSPSAHVYSWIAEVQRLQGVDCRSAARAAWDLAADLPLVPKLLLSYSSEPPVQVVQHEFERLIPGGLPRGESGVAILRSVLERLQNNRSGLWTECSPTGELIARRLPISPREYGAYHHHLLRTRTIPEVRELFRIHAKDVGRYPLYLTYWGELELWFGHYQHALELFEEALRADPITLWARIGRGAALMFLGDPVAALKNWEALSYDGPTVYVYRAEAWLKCGDQRAAESELIQALSQKSTRLSAWLLLAMLEHDRGAPELAAALVSHLRTQQLGLPELAAGDDRACLQGLWTSLQGNRSSTTVVIERGVEAQFVEWGPARWLADGAVLGRLSRPTDEKRPHGSWVGES